MNQTSNPLEQLLIEIRESVSCASRISIVDTAADAVTIQVGSSTEALVSISIHDPERPSFSATFPNLREDRKTGASEIMESTSTGLLADGVKWIVRKVFKFGFVPPEGYRKEPRNTGATDRSHKQRLN